MPVFSRSLQSHAAEQSNAAEESDYAAGGSSAFYRRVGDDNDALSAVAAKRRRAAVILGYRFFGAALLAIGLIFWLAKDCQDRTAIRALLVASAVSNAAGAAVSIWGSATGIMNALGWTVVLIYAVLLAGSIYFLQQPPAR